MLKKLSPYLFPLLVSITILLGYFAAKYYQKPASYTIKITKDGFIPKNITIKQDDQITWINTDTKPHWPASDYHPTHSQYPSSKNGCIGSTLDSCKGLGQDARFTFLFSETGSWDMHDHLFPEMTMNVRVEKQNPIASTLSNIPSRITGLFQNSESTSTDAFRKLSEKRKRKVITELTKKDPKKAWTFLKQAAIINGQTTANSHEFAHIIGHALYNKYGLEGISTCGNSFSYGCYHGAISGALVKDGLSAIGTLETSCLKSFKTENKQNPRECIHGLGHGIITLHNLELSPSLKSCDLLRSKEYRRDCYMGIFMEYSYLSPENLNTNDPWSFCTDLPSPYQSACAAYFPKLLIEKYGSDLPRIGSICMGASSITLWKSCMDYVGAHIAVVSLGDSKKISEQCEKMESKKGNIYCVIGAVAQIKYEKYPDWQKSGRGLCQQLPAEFQEECINNFNQIPN